MRWSARPGDARAGPASSEAALKPTAPAAPAAPTSAPGPARSGDRGFAIGLAAAVIAAALVHAASLGAPFFADDWLFLDQARARSLPAVLASPDPIGNFFRPLGRQVWFWLWANVSGESPVVFHAANLALFLGAVVLLGLLARRVSGAFAGVVAAAFLALHYAADVPVLWSSGSQELLALTAGLAALLAHVRGRRVAGALLFLGALLCKESIVLLPLAAAALDDGEGGWRGRARRLVPMLVTLVAWVALAAWATLRRGTPGAGLLPDAAAPLAVPVLLARVVFGIEWPTGGFPFVRIVDPGGPFWVALLLALAGVWAAAPPLVRAAPAARKGKKGARPAPAPASAPAEPERRAPRGVIAGLVWAVAGALPVVVVAPIWSAYYFLFSIAGVALALGAWLARRPAARAARVPPAFAACAVLAVRAWMSSQARGTQEFATARSPWSAQSHVNRFYMERGMSVVARAVADLRTQVPDPEPRTSFFFAGLPAFASVQVGDGPLVRGVFRDSSLRGHYLSEMTRERLGRGPWRIFFYESATGHIKDQTRTRGVLLSSALGAVLNGRPASADIALEAARSHGEGELGVDYLGAFVALELGDTARAYDMLRRGGYGLGRNGGPAADRARDHLARRDSVAAVEVLRLAIGANTLDPELHGLLADILVERPHTRPEGQVEAYAARLLEPDRAAVWRRWGYVLALELRIPEAIAALDRYAKMDPVAASRDERANRLRQTLPRMLPGGDIAQRAMKREHDR